MIFSRFGPVRVRGLKIIMLEPPRQGSRPENQDITATPPLFTLYRPGIFNFVHFAAEGCVDKIKDAGTSHIIFFREF